MSRGLLVFIAKLLMRLLRMGGRSGSALPGLIIERLDPKFLETTLKPFEKKIIIVTGTNGKTTTTKMLVEALRARSKVITNATGSNMTRGLIAALVENMTLLGRLEEPDWFVFEMDEAYTPLFTANLSPKLLVGLNVLRDQLDRYGEIDKTAQLIQEAALRSDIFIYSQLDPALSRIAGLVRKKGGQAKSFGVDEKLLGLVSNEQTLHGSQVWQDETLPAVVLQDVQEIDYHQSLELKLTGDRRVVSIPVQGFHNALNAAAVAAVLQALELDIEAGFSAIAKMPTPFGRGERLVINDKNITVALVKNPSGFTSNSQTFIKKQRPELVLFVINDKIADGRDISWLWDVNFKGEIPEKVTLMTSGLRAYDMSLRLKHDGYEAKAVLDVAEAVEQVLKADAKDVAIIPTYTALFEVREALARHGEVPRIW